MNSSASGKENSVEKFFFSRSLLRWKIKLKQKEKKEKKKNHNDDDE